MKKNRILGITALVAVVGLGMMFTACPPLDEEERIVEFINQSEAVIYIICQGSSPSSFTLKDAPSGGQTSQTVTRKGQDVVLTSIEVTSPDLHGDEWRYLNISGSATGGKTKGNGITLGSGIIRFNADTTQLDNPLRWKVNAVALDE